MAPRRTPRVPVPIPPSRPQRSPLVRLQLIIFDLAQRVEPEPVVCAALVLVLTMTGVYFGTTCVWWWHNESPAVAAVGEYMCLLTISSMFATVSA